MALVIKENMKTKLSLLFIPILLLLNQTASADDLPLKDFSISGSGFYRYETKKEADYNNLADDNRQSSQTRIDLAIKANLTENYGYVYFAPQFSKISGQDEMVLTSTTPTASSQQTSGATYDPKLNIHQAFFAINPTQQKNITLFAGRQELSYGDQLIVGAVPWSRIGRSFDLVKARYILNESFSADLFTAKLQENNFIGTSSGNKADDSDLHGLYILGDLGSYAKNVDLYFLKKNDFTSAGNPFLETSALGLRAKSKISDTSFDYRTEITSENTTIATSGEKSKSEYQYDIEVGYTHSYHNSRLAFEYFDSSKNYDQLFPTGHKYLGYADQFSRRNITGYAAHLSSELRDNLSLAADYHIFNRHDTSSPAYNFNGASNGAVGTNKKIAKELDLVATYNFTSTLQVSLGYSWVMPDTYIKDQAASNSETTEFSYMQLMAKF